MHESPFLDYRQSPTAKEVRAALGSKLPLWERLTAFAEETLGATGTWSRFGPARTGWNLRYRRGGKSLTALHPMREHVLVQVVLGAKQAGKALELELGDAIARMLRETPQLRDGRWLFIPITDESEAADVESLLLLKMSPRRRA